MSLDAYRRKRNAARTPEPVAVDSAGTGEINPDAADGGVFVVQEHHARTASLHWDFRLERDGVLAPAVISK